MTTTPSPAGGYRPIAVTDDERRQIEEQLRVCFGLTARAARTWVDTSVRTGSYYAWKDGDRVAASLAVEPLDFARPGGERLRSVLLQSHYIHPDYRGRGYRVTPAFLDAVMETERAEVVILCLYEPELTRYWEEVGFAVEHGRDVLTVGEALERWAAGLVPVVTPRYLGERLEEAEADGAGLTRADGLVLIRARGSEAHTELLVTDPERARTADPALLAEPLELITIMSYPGRVGLFCPIGV